MKRYTITFVVMLFLVFGESNINAQDINITKFEQNYTSLVARITPVEDNNGEACAVICFFVRDMDYVIEPFLGILKSDTLPGEIRMWVPKDTKRITVKHPGLLPLVGFSIPIRLESKTTYEAWIDVVTPTTRTENANKKNNVCFGAGYNFMSIAGPSLSLGLDMKHHNIEVGAVYGLNKTDDLFFYDNGNVFEAYNYRALRLNLRYGFSFEATDFFTIIPQVGGGYNIITGKDAETFSNPGKNYQNAYSINVFGAIRFVVALNDHFKFQVTPEYDFGVYKNNNCKWISFYDDTFNKWTDGFNLNVGLMISF